MIPCMISLALMVNLQSLRNHYEELVCYSASSSSLQYAPSSSSSSSLDVLGTQRHKNYHKRHVSGHVFSSSCPSWKRRVSWLLDSWHCWNVKKTRCENNQKEEDTEIMILLQHNTDDITHTFAYNWRVVWRSSPDIQGSLSTADIAWFYKLWDDHAPRMKCCWWEVSCFVAKIV